MYEVRKCTYCDKVFENEADLVYNFENDEWYCQPCLEWEDDDFYYDYEDDDV